MKRLKDAERILADLGMPPGQRNAVAVHTFLAFAGLDPRTPWTRARAVRTGTHGVIDFVRERYGKSYAENTRETIRRHAIHQFVQGGILVRNPDDPTLPTNSPRTHYALTDEALRVVQSFGRDEYEGAVQDFLEGVRGGLVKRYAGAREQAKVPVTLPTGHEVLLSPGRHNELQRAVVEKFLPQFAQGAILLYLGDTDEKGLHIDGEELGKLGVQVPQHDKLPDILAYDPERNWLFLIEAVTSHGPVTPKRYVELENMFAESSAGRIYVSAFATATEFRSFADRIAWETEVWFAESPTHLLHFNGDRFLGPR